MAQYQKTTIEMENDLNCCDDIEAFLVEQQDRFLDTDVPQFLAEFLKQTGQTKSAVIRRSGLSQVYGYQIFSGFKHPDRDKLLCVAIACGMNVTQTDHLLTAGKRPPLYPRVIRDALIEFALNHHYTIEQTDDLLYDHDCKTLTNA